MRVRGFRSLVASYTINDAGDAIGLVALAILVFDRTGDALATSGLFVASKFVPALIAPLLAARLDQVSPRKVLFALYFVEALCFVALARFAGDGFTLGVVLGLALVYGTLAVTARAITRGTLGALLKPVGLLREGNALFNIGFAISSVAGAALGGLSVDGLGVADTLYINAGVFAAAGLVLAFTRSLPSGEEEREPLAARLRGGLAYVKGAPVIRLLLAGEALALIFFTLIVPIEVIYAKETLDAGDAGFGILLSAWGAGIFIGSLLFAASKRHAPLRLAVTATAAVGVAYVGMSLTDQLVVAASLCVLGGIGNGLQYVSVMTSLQEETPLAFQTRAVALLESIAAAMPGIGFLIGGLLASATSPPTAFAIAGAGALLVASAGIALQRTGRFGAPSERPAPPPPPGSNTLAFAATAVIVVAAVATAVRSAGRGR